MSTNFVGWLLSHRLILPFIDDRFFVLQRDAGRKIGAGRGERIISHLIDPGFMATARSYRVYHLRGGSGRHRPELEGVAAWHLFDRMELRMRFLTGERDRPIAILRVLRILNASLCCFIAGP